MKPIAECDLSVDTSEDLDPVPGEVRVCVTGEQLIQISIENAIEGLSFPSARLYFELEDAQLLAAQIEQTIQVATGDLSRATGGFNLRQPSSGYSGFVPHAGTPKGRRGDVGNAI